MNPRSEPGSSALAGSAGASPLAALDNRQASATMVWLSLIFVSALWGTAGIATQAVLREGIAPYELSTLRMTVASVLVLACLAAKGRRVRITQHLLGDGLVLALVQVVLPSVLFAVALEHLAAGPASLLYALVPAATALWMRLLLHSGHLGAWGILGLAMAVGGAAFVALSPTSASTGGAGSMVGAGMVVVSVVVTSFATVYAKRHANHPLLEVMAPEILIGTMLLLVPGLVRRSMDWGGLSLGTWAVIGYLAVGVTVVPAALLLWLVKRTSALRVAFVNYLFPLVAVVLGVVWFGEQLTTGVALGGFVLLLGVAIVEATDGRTTDRGQLRPCPELAGIPMSIDKQNLQRPAPGNPARRVVSSWFEPAGRIAPE